MAKKQRVKTQKKAPPPGVIEFAKTCFAIMYGPLEELTDELIEELVAAGFPREDLLWSRSKGFVYSRKLNSLTSQDLIWEE